MTTETPLPLSGPLVIQSGQDGVRFLAARDEPRYTKGIVPNAPAQGAHLSIAAFAPLFVRVWGRLVTMEDGPYDFSDLWEENIPNAIATDHAEVKELFAESIDAALDFFGVEQLDGEDRLDWLGDLIDALETAWPCLKAIGEEVQADTEEGLTALYTAWMEEHDLRLGCAAEAFSAGEDLDGRPLTQGEKDWLNDFSVRWEAVMQAQDAERRSEARLRAMESGEHPGIC